MNLKKKQSWHNRDTVQNLSRGTEENHEKQFFFGIVEVPTEIRTEHFPNTSVQRHRYIILLCVQGSL
jgi:hypothetical protein